MPVIPPITPLLALVFDSRPFMRNQPEDLSQVVFGYIRAYFWAGCLLALAGLICMLFYSFIATALADKGLAGHVNTADRGQEVVSK